MTACYEPDMNERPLQSPKSPSLTASSTTTLTASSSSTTTTTTTAVLNQMMNYKELTALKSLLYEESEKANGVNENEQDDNGDDDEQDQSDGFHQRKVGDWGLRIRDWGSRNDWDWGVIGDWGLRIGIDWDWLGLDWLDWIDWIDMLDTDQACISSFNPIIGSINSFQNCD